MNPDYIKFMFLNNGAKPSCYECKCPTEGKCAMLVYDTANKPEICAAYTMREQE
jgi:hypothetical protein